MTRRSKFNAAPAEVDGIRFDSRAEAREYVRLRSLEDAGKIADLVLQPKFVCDVNGKRICTYRADFRYREGDRSVVSDVKGVSTAAFKLKRKLVEALHGVEIKIVPA